MPGNSWSKLSIRLGSGKYVFQLIWTVVTICGTNKATIRIITISEADVRIAAGYDGAMEATIDTSWESLLDS